MIVGVIPKETGFSHCEEIITLFFRIRLSAKAAHRIFGHQFTKVVESIILIIILLWAIALKCAEAAPQSFCLLNLCEQRQSSEDKQQEQTIFIQPKAE